MKTGGAGVWLDGPKSGSNIMAMGKGLCGKQYEWKILKMRELLWRQRC